ncbi:MAG: putative 6-oxopurine nucleoside phosphorylase [Herpetosiphonaceae bacterium]|nr:MAG: putative 6-oxopurine nucleoside phosphorylase [Herpetosiphonaceae bacterium]
MFCRSRSYEFVVCRASYIFSMTDSFILLHGGTGAYFLDLEAELGPGTYRTIDTPYGPAGSIYLPDRWQGRLGLASRHGWGRLEVSPPFVNSRANLWAAKALGARAILSWNGVGAINPLLEVHDLVVLDGIIDVTKTRVRSFNPPSDRPGAHHSLPSIERPFDPALSRAIYEVARADRIRAFPVGVYACSEGPRLETMAEITALGRFGAEIVGMTLVPEVFLAAELGIPFASLCYVTNYATGVEPAPGAPRFFGVEVAQTCLRLLLRAVERIVDHLQ